MGQLRQRDTGSVVNVPDEDEAAVLALGQYEPVKAPAKKAAAKKSSK
jgi:hypothetical protein